jgi:hypothetical protein
MDRFQIMLWLSSFRCWVFLPGSAVATFPTSQLNDSYISLPKHFGRMPGRKDSLAPVPTLLDQITGYLRKANNKVPKDTVCIIEFGGACANTFDCLSLIVYLPSIWCLPVISSAPVPPPLAKAPRTGERQITKCRNKPSAFLSSEVLVLLFFILFIGLVSAT